MVALRRRHAPSHVCLQRKPIAPPKMPAPATHEDKIHVSTDDISFFTQRGGFLPRVRLEASEAGKKTDQKYGLDLDVQ
jgi:hypothetical protein